MPTTHRRAALHRATAAAQSQPWWFSTRTGNAGPGRFDLAGGGTCYLAHTPAAALLEAAIDPDVEDPVIVVDDLERLTVWSGPVPSARNLADTTRPSVPGLTGEIGTVVPYDLAWLWADAFRAAGRAGISYRSRFGQDRSVALFSESAGAPVDETDARYRGTLRRLPALAFLGALPKEMVTVIGEGSDYEQAPAP